MTEKLTTLTFEHDQKQKKILPQQRILMGEFDPKSKSLDHPLNTIFSVIKNTRLVHMTK